MIHALLLVAAAHASEGSVAYHLEQARQFARNKWYEDAAAEIAAGLAQPGGATDYDLAWLGTQVYYELNDIDQALALARVALDHAPTDAARDQARAWHDFLAGTFGWVTVTGARANLSSRLQLEPTSVFLDPELKRLVNRLALQLREPQRLPVTVALPAGDYLVNGAPLTVTAGQRGELALGLDQLGARGMAALQVPRLEVAVGTQMLFGERVSNLSPGGVLELAYTHPVGPLLVGALLDGQLRAYNGGYGAGAPPRVVDPRAGSVGLKVGQEVSIGGPVALRPALGARYGWVPGIALDCFGSETALACGDPGKTPPDARVYATGTAVAPFLEVAAEYREAGRTTALGLGVKATVEELIGRVPAAGSAVDDATGQPLDWTADTVPWLATGVRLSVTVDLAF